MNTTNDSWAAGESYEQFMGRWSRPLAHEFLAWLAAVPNQHWLDVGTGTGAMAHAICKDMTPASVTAIDPSESFIDSARRGISDPRVSFAVAGAGTLPPREGGYDVIVSGLALNFFPDPAAAIIEQLGLVRPEGVVAAFVWDYSEGMAFLRYFWDAATEVTPRAAELDEGKRFPICRPDALTELYESAGSRNVRVAPMAVPTRFPNFDDYWRPFLAGTGPAPALVASLSRDDQELLKERLRGRLPVGETGSIELSAKAWAVAGTK